MRFSAEFHAQCRAASQPALPRPTISTSPAATPRQRPLRSPALPARTDRCAAGRLCASTALGRAAELAVPLTPSTVMREPPPRRLHTELAAASGCFRHECPFRAPQPRCPHRAFDACMSRRPATRVMYTGQLRCPSHSLVLSGRRCGTPPPRRDDQCDTGYQRYHISAMAAPALRPTPVQRVRTSAISIASGSSSSSSRSRERHVRQRPAECVIWRVAC